MNKLITDPTRCSILNAAERLFVRYGYKKTTVDEIAQEAHVGKGTVYLHFQSKEDVGMCWLRRLHEGIYVQLEQICREPLDAKVRLRKFMEQRVLLRFDIFQCHQRSMDEALASIPAETLDHYRQEFHQREKHLLRALIEEGRSQGSFSCPEPDQTGEAMIIATNSLMPYKQRPQLLGDRTEVFRKVGIVADLIIRSVDPNHE